jgi:hypothetical protein
MVQSIRIYHYFRFGFYILILLEGTKSLGVTIRKGFYWICAGYPIFRCFWDHCFFWYGHSTGMMIWCQCLRMMKPASTAWCFLSRWENHPTKDMFAIFTQIWLQYLLVSEVSHDSTAQISWGLSVNKSFVPWPERASRVDGPARGSFAGCWNNRNQLCEVYVK